MEKIVIRDKSLRSKRTAPEIAEKKSFLGSMFYDFFVAPSIYDSITYLNILMAYFCAIAAVAGFQLSYWYALLYLPPIYVFLNYRRNLKEKHRLEIAHRIPFFADALANSLSVGMTLEQAFEQSSYYLKGKIRDEFNILMVKHALGQDLGRLLRDLDTKFPNTGLTYLISLLEEYQYLGVGISPLLKKIADALTLKEEAEQKIRTILAGGSSYARLSVSLFGLIFAGMAFLLRDQMALLAEPSLKPIFILLLIWGCFGILVVTRVTSIDFARNFALRPLIKDFLSQKKLTIDEKMKYSGMEWPPWKKLIFEYFPMVAGFIAAYVSSWYNGSPMVIGLGFLAGAGLCWYLFKFILEGLVEDELIHTIEKFPEFLQVFIIGLNSGLNIYLSLQFAQQAISSSASKILFEELCRTKFAMECGEEHSRTWERFAEALPFETIIDFCEIMVIAPTHGESIVRSIIQMSNGYQVKKLALVEKKAVSLSQLVIPIIVMAFFPLFLFIVFAPLLTQISVFLNK